jgi:hypothetical protein
MTRASAFRRNPPSLLDETPQLQCTRGTISPYDAPAKSDQIVILAEPRFQAVEVRQLTAEPDVRLRKTHRVPERRSV